MGYDLDFRATVHLPSVFTATDAMSGATVGCYPQGTREYQTLDPTRSFGVRIGLWVLGQVPPKKNRNGLFTFLGSRTFHTPLHKIICFVRIVRNLVTSNSTFEQEIPSRDYQTLLIC